MNEPKKVKKKGHPQFITLCDASCSGRVLANAPPPSFYLCERAVPDASFYRMALACSGDLMSLPSRSRGGDLDDSTQALDTGDSFALPRVTDVSVLSSCAQGSSSEGY